MEKLIEQIKKAEGFRGMPYKDTLGIPTIGYGTKLPIDEEEAELLLKKRLNDTIKDLKRAYPKFEELPPTIQEVLLDMGYNMGIPRLMKFKKMWKAIDEGDWNKMADEMVDSRWYRQVGNRAKNLVQVVRDYAEWVM